MTDETTVDVDAQINDTDTEVEQEEVEQKEETKEDKRPSSVVKLLKQRNELKKQVEELAPLKDELPKMKKQLEEMNEMIARQTLETEAKQEKTEFFNKYPAAKEFDSEISKLSESKNLSYDEAFKLYAADNHPELLVDEQYRNKAKSTAKLTWVTKEQTKDVDHPESVKDFDSLDDFGKRSDKMGAQSRKAEWYSN